MHPKIAKKGWVIVKASDYLPRDSGSKSAAETDPTRYLEKPDRRRIFLEGLACCLWWLMPAPVRAAEQQRFTVHIEGGDVAKDRRTIRVTEGDSVEIEFTSDRKLTLHLHGIDIETTVAPGKPTVMRFDATVAGRFPVEAHGTGAHAGLVYVEVYPR